MSDQDTTSAVALVVALVALLVSTAQLLQAIFGTAEGFRRTNRQIMGPFSQTRDRVFHITELRFETTFRTPHFRFRTADSIVEPEKDFITQNGSLPMRTRVRNSSHKVAEKQFMYMEACDNNNKGKVVQDFITSGAVGSISKLQRVLRWVDSGFNRPSHRQLIEKHSKAYVAGWLVLLDQLFEREIRVHHAAEGADYRHKRLSPIERSIFASAWVESTTIKTGAHPQEWHRPAMELEERSWDLMPPDIVRPLASIDLGDILTLCFRLCIEVHPEEKPWSAEGLGHSFSPLRVQGLGTVVQYRFDPSLSHVDDDDFASSCFAPSEACDKLAFGIISAYPELGIMRDWKVNAAPSIIDSILAHFQELGVSEETRRMIREDDDPPWEDHLTHEALCESLLLLCPPLLVDGLGIVKYVPPYPQTWAECTLRYRESYLVLRIRLNEMYPGLPGKEARMNQVYPGPTEREKINLMFRESQNPPTRRSGVSGNFWMDRMEWVGAVLNFFERTQHDHFVPIYSLHTLFGKNAKGAMCEEVLRQLRTALDEADRYLYQFGFAETGAYQALVAAHVEMALIRHTEVKGEWLRQERNRLNFRDETGVPGVSSRKTETTYQGEGGSLIGLRKPCIISTK